MSSARTVTSISPATPVSSWRVFTSFSACRSRGTSSRTSETTSLCVSTAQPTIATARPTASTRRGRVTAYARPRSPRLATPSLTFRQRRANARPGRDSASERPAPRARSRTRGKTGGTSDAVRSPRKRTSAAKPAVTAHASASTMPSTTSAPKPRTIGTGESSSTRKPTAVASPAVAIVGPPAAAARAAASRSSPLPSPRSSSCRAWNWIA